MQIFATGYLEKNFNAGSQSDSSTQIIFDLRKRSDFFWLRNDLPFLNLHAHGTVALFLFSHTKYNVCHKVACIGSIAVYLKHTAEEGC